MTTNQVVGSSNLPQRAIFKGILPGAFKSGVPMTTKVAIKLAALLTALTFTICAIIWMKNGHMNAFWTSLGFETGDRISWCSERVQSMYHFESGSKLLEKDGKWLWQDKDKSEKELDYLRVEKWFARYCQVPFAEISDSDEWESSNQKPLFEVAFIDSDRSTIFGRSDEGTVFKIQNREFQSETLRNGLQELLAFGDEIK